MTTPESALARAGRFSLCAQTGTPPYQYVSVEGPITATEVADLEWDLRRLAQRYLGVNTGDRYIEQTRDASAQAEYVLIRMRPERWLTVDYAKAYGTLRGAPSSIHPWSSEFLILLAMFGLLQPDQQAA